MRLYYNLLRMVVKSNDASMFCIIALHCCHKQLCYFISHTRSAYDVLCTSPQQLHMPLNISCFAIVAIGFELQQIIIDSIGFFAAIP